MTPDDTRTIVLTGVSRGIGLSAAELLVRRRPQDQYVVLARKGAAACAASLSKAVDGSRVVGVDCDLSSLQQVRDAAGWIGAELDAGRLAPLGGLLGNAGVVLPTTSTATVEGHETIFGVNVLAHYLLVRLLLHHFVAPAWIVLTTSDTHFGQFRYTLGAVPKPRWESPKSLATPRPGGFADGSRAYATSKLGTIYLVHALARRVPAGVVAFSYNPGLVGGTELFRGAPAFMKAVLRVYYSSQLAVGRGTSTQKAGERLATTLLADWSGDSGSYLDRGRETPSSPESYDLVREEELWTEAARLAGLEETT
ncbi:SDR family NAD(P)-dependent oxidoreductase [Kribbella sp. NPDC056861]|uniref:SDR family NAD(P)-dependent oxidoreductase n=1 Tax=Kribbella sp. NPDC056861 TaxID=3154857 RepID=UPI00342FB370